LPEGATVEVTVVAAEKPAPGPRGVPAEQVRGIAADESPPPDDETVKRWIQDRCAQKFG